MLSHAGGLYNEMRRNATELEKYARELESLSQRKVLAWTGAGTRHLGAALALLGQTEEGIAIMQEGIGECRSLDILCNFTGTLTFLAEAQIKKGEIEEGLHTIEDACAMVESTGERNWEAELWRMRAQLLQMKGDEAGAEASLLKSIQVAQGQNAKSWELRSTVDLARLWQKQGKLDEARKNNWRDLPLVYRGV